MSEKPYSEKREELINKAKESRDSLKDNQRDILESIQEEHGGDLIETPVTIAGNHTATVKTKIDGSLINRLSEIETSLNESEGGLRSVEETMDRAATLLDDILVEDDYDKALFYGVYEAEGPEALGAIIQKVFNAIEKEQERIAGSVEGFRQAPKDS